MGVMQKKAAAEKAKNKPTGITDPGFPLTSIVRVEYCKVMFDNDKDKFIAPYGGTFCMRAGKFSEDWRVYQFPPSPNTDKCELVPHPVLGYHMPKETALEFARTLEETNRKKLESE